MKILVTGKTGQLGCELKNLSPKFDFNWIFLDRNDFDLLNLKKIDSVLNKYIPDVIINCAAFTSVDDAEINFEQANIVNNKSLGLIALWCYKNNCKLIHISSDYVYGKNSEVPISEINNTTPINNYGKTKLLGEQVCRKLNPNSIIIRTSWLYSIYGSNFLKKIIDSMKHNRQINVVNDQYGSPTYAADLSKVIIGILTSSFWKSGIYNYSNNGAVSRYDFANDIKEIYGFNTIIKPISTNELISNVKRPKYSVLDNTKIKDTYKLSLIPYKYSLVKCIKLLKDEK